MQKKLSTAEGTQANEIIANLIKDELDRFKNEGVQTPLNKYITDYPHTTVYAVKKILDFSNRQNQE